MPVHYPIQLKTDATEGINGNAQIRIGMKPISRLAIEDVNGEIEYIPGSFGGNEKEWANGTRKVWDLFTPREKDRIEEARRLYNTGQYAKLLWLFNSDSIEQIEAGFLKKLERPREYVAKSFRKTVYRISKRESIAQPSAGNMGKECKHEHTENITVPLIEKRYSVTYCQDCRSCVKL